MIGFTDFFQVYWWVVLLVMAGLALGARFYVQSTSGRYVWDRYKMYLPVMGGILERIYLARFARNLSTLVAGGIPIIQNNGHSKI